MSVARILMLCLLAPPGFCVAASAELPAAHAAATDPALADVQAARSGTAETPAASSQEKVAVPGWRGVGELGLAIARGNSRSDTANGKLEFTFEDASWKHAVSASVLRARGEVESEGGASRLELSANRLEVGGETGYKFDERAYVIGTVRVEHDDFSAFERQATVAASYGLTAVTNARTALRFEIGPGYRQAHILDDGDANGLIVRGSSALTHALTGTTELSHELLLESGGDNRFLQNDLGLAVKVTDALKLKTAFQLRRNSETAAGTVSTDRLFTTNFVYGF